MTWMLTSTGAEYHLTGPAALAASGRPVDIRDVAHHLAMVNQFNGATTRPYSVPSTACCAATSRGAPAHRYSCKWPR